MAGPTFKSAGTIISGQTGNSITASLPGSLVNGDLLLYCQYGSNENPTFTVTSGWTMVDAADNLRGGIVCWRIVDGTQGSSVTFTWTGNSSVGHNAVVLAFSGANTTNPIGGWSTMSASMPGSGGSSTITAQSTFKSSHSNSLMFAMLGTASNVVPGTPTNWTSATSVTNGPAGGTNWVYESIATSYTAIDPISVSGTGGVSQWSTITLEIMGAASVPLPSVKQINGLANGTGNWTSVSSGNTSTITGSLPAVRKTGDLLIGVATRSQSGGVTYTWPGDWTPIISTTTTSSLSLAYRLVDGTETNPVVSVSTSQASACLITVVTNVRTSNFIGAKAINSGSGTTVSVSGIVTQQPNSLILGFGSALGGLTSGYSSGYVCDLYGGIGVGNCMGGWEYVATAGATSDPTSFTVTSSAWSAALIELPGLVQAVFPHSFGYIIN